MAKKLRSRLIRSPIPQGESEASRTSSSSLSSKGGIVTTARIATTSGEVARHSTDENHLFESQRVCVNNKEGNHLQQDTQEYQQAQRRRSQRLQSNHSNRQLVAATQAEDQINSTSTEPSSASCKRKPDNRGIIRRAKTAMFRIATSPMTSSSSTMMPFYYSPPRHNLIQLTSNAKPSDEVRVNYDDVVPYSPLQRNECILFPIHVSPTKNVLEWMNDVAPPEIMLRILSFCGSRRLNALSRTNKSWNSVVKDESVWRVLSEDTHKVRDQNYFVLLEKI